MTEQPTIPTPPTAPADTAPPPPTPAEAAQKEVSPRAEDLHEAPPEVVDDSTHAETIEDETEAEDLDDAPPEVVDDSTEAETVEDEPEEPEAVAPPPPPSVSNRRGLDGGEKEPAKPQEAPAAPPSNKRWYVVKVQSGREETIKESIERRVKIEGLEEYYGQVIIPVETVVEMRAGKRLKRERKLYPGYLMVEVEYNDRILYLFRETSGVGDFVGGSMNHPPPPMSEREVERMLGRQGGERPVTAKPKFDRGDRVKVKDGTFSGMEGEVKELLEAKSLVRVELTIFGRPVPVELEYWQIENV